MRNIICKIKKLIKLLRQPNCSSTTTKAVKTFGSSGKEGAGEAFVYDDGTNSVPIANATNGDGDTSNLSAFNRHRAAQEITPFGHNGYDNAASGGHKKHHHHKNNKDVADHRSTEKLLRSWNQNSECDLF